VGVSPAFANGERKRDAMALAFPSIVRRARLDEKAAGSTCQP
jgi:hypothetical protein